MGLRRIIVEARGEKMMSMDTPTNVMSLKAVGGASSCSIDTHNKIYVVDV